MFFLTLKLDKLRAVFALVLKLTNESKNGLYTAYVSYIKGTTRMAVCLDKEPQELLIT